MSMEGGPRDPRSSNLEARHGSPFARNKAMASKGSVGVGGNVGALGPAARRPFVARSVARAALGIGGKPLRCPRLGSVRRVRSVRRGVLCHGGAFMRGRWPCRSSTGGGTSRGVYGRWRRGGRVRRARVWTRRRSRRSRFRRQVVS